MAAPSVTLGITTLTDSDQNTGYEDYGAGQGSGAETDYYVQRTGTNADRSISRTVSNDTKGMYYDITAGGLSAAPFDTNITPTQFDAGNHVYVWMYVTGYPATNTTDNGGVRILFTDGTANVTKQFYVDGSENTTGGWKCYVASAANTTDLTENQGGTLGANLGSTTNVIGVGGICNTVQSVGKANFAIDAIRVGTGLTITRGEFDNAAGFTTITDINDDIENAYGVFAATGSGAEIRGNITIGFDDTTTDTYFSDSNYVIFNPNKNPRFGTTNTTQEFFTKVDIVGSATTAIFSNVSFISGDPYDKGVFDAGTARFEPANVQLDGCTFQRWGSTVLCGTGTATNSTWIGCERIFLANGAMDNCTVEAGVGKTYVVAASVPNNISNTSFITPTSGVGTGHAIEVTASGTYDFVNNTFQNEDGGTYGVTDTDTAAIHINGAGLDVTFNISGNDATAEPTYKLTGAGATVAFNAAVTVNVTGLPVVPEPQDATEIRVLVAGQDLFATATGIGTTNPDVGIGTEAHRTSTFSFNIKKDFDFDLRIINLDYAPQFISSIRSTNDPTDVSANLKIDRVSQNDKQ